VTPLAIAQGRRRLALLCIGAHSDDIEIGAGGLVLTLAEAIPELHVHWCVLSAAGARAAEARCSAGAFLQGVYRFAVEIGGFEDSYFPDQGRDIKLWLAEVRSRFAADVVLVHGRDDAHQDHRELNRIAWNLFRDHLILEYEIPKWDGDLGRPNVYAALELRVLEQKIDLLLRHFGTQRSKDWFDAETFRGLARIRGMECRAESGYAEAFVVRKALIAQAPPTLREDPARDLASRRVDARDSPRVRRSPIDLTNLCGADE
jgi:LmbE family N-acetylglucosaminyl deacetylase